MANLFNLCDRDGEVMALIETDLTEKQVTDQWEDYYDSSQYEIAEEDDEVIETFIGILLHIGATVAEHRFIDNITLQQ